MTITVPFSPGINQELNAKCHCGKMEFKIQVGTKNEDHEHIDACTNCFNLITVRFLSRLLHPELTS